MAINLFVPKFHTEEILEEIRLCLDKGWTGLGFKTIEFEDKWKEYTKLPHAHFVNSNTVGLHLALNMLKKKYHWKDGDEIITTPITFVSTNHAILYEKLIPVFADIDDYLSLDPEDIKKKITDRTKAVMFVGVGGNTGRLEEVVNICKESDLKLILDGAHMAGTKLYDKHVGADADVSVFSFQAVKNLPTADSGMICWADEEMDSWARKLSWLGISKDTFSRFNTSENSYKWEYNVPDVGFKYHGNSIMAAIGIIQLKYLDEDNKYRNELASIYDKLLGNENKVKLVKIAPHCSSSRHLYQIRIQKRDLLLQFFYDNEIFPGVHYIDNTKYPMYSYARNTCANASMVSNEIISLPLHLNLNEEDVYTVVDVLMKGISFF